MQVSRQIEIQASAERVFACLDDPALLSQWMTGLQETCYETAAAPREGARFTQRLQEFGRTITYAGEVRIYTPPERLRLALVHPRLQMMVDYRLAELAPGRTRLDYDVELTPTDAAVSRLAGLMGWYARRMTQAQLERLRDLAQARHAKPA
ncbi:MAG: SRPBCC family protein [Pseudomonadota bacterium]|nr:SRPBCC family protein [Pseudomonadota bacterium]HJO35208.1 SRPBCC family protein [Gammaproteobacteria bacterium]